MSNESDVRAAEIAAAEARADTKIARVEGKIDTAVATLVAEIRGLRDDIHRSDGYNQTTRWAIIGTVVASMGILAGVLAWGGDQWSRGLSQRDLIQTVIKDYADSQKKDAQPPSQK